MDPNSENITERLELINQLKNFLASAPDGQQEAIKQHTLSPNEVISCVKWNDAFYISGTDIVRSLVFRFHTFGRPIKHLKKFEEGIFSDLRNLKPGVDAILEEPKSAFLDLLFQNNCIRTQKKQKVFYWYSVPHDRLFLDALERDLKREKMGIEPTSNAVAHPAIAISLDTTQAMFDNFRKSILSELNLGHFYNQQQSHSSSPPASVCSSATDDTSDSSIVSPTNQTSAGDTNGLTVSRKNDLRKLSSASSTIFGQFSLFEGSPTYKQRRRRVTLNNQQQQQQQQQQKQTTQLENNNKRKFNSNNRGSSSSPSYSSHHEDESTRHWRSNNNDELSSANNNTDDDTTSNTTRYFHCPLTSCDKFFKRLEHMKRHLRTHTMERPYMCDVCGKRFSRSDNLAQHKKTHDRNKSIRGNSVQPSSSRSQGSKKSLTSKPNINTSTKTSSSGRKASTNGFLSKSINKSFPGRQRSLALIGGSGNSHGNNDISYARSIYHENTTTSISTRRSSLPLPIVTNRGRILRRNAHRQHQQQQQERRQPYQHHSRLNNDNVEAAVIYESDWEQHHTSIEYLKVEPEQMLQPELSISTTSSSSTSSCNTSPTCTRLPTIKIEDVEPFYDLQQQQQQQTEDTAMMMVEEFLPQQHQYCWEDESASDWQRRVDWNQYSSPGSVHYDNTEDLIMESYNNEHQESLASFANYYYLNQPSPQYNQYDVVSNASSCLASPTMVSTFLIETTATTSTSNSAATTVVNSPIMRTTTADFHPTHYYSNESPTITPSDALLQRH